MKHILIVVDIQKDFVDGALGTAEAVAMIGNAAKVIAGFDAIFSLHTTRILKIIWKLQREENFLCHIA